MGILRAIDRGKNNVGTSREYGRAITEGPTPADAAGARALPYPSGWAALAFSDELRPGTVLTRPLAGSDVVLYRLGTGVLRAVRPYCPHLGAHLGLARVDGDDLVCPFHSFAFDPDGTCVLTGYGTPPPRSALTRLPVHEVNGAVFVWRHHDGQEPDWKIPRWHEIGSRPPRMAAWELAGNVQEVIENSVDLGHFATLHRWARAEIGGPVLYDGFTFHVSMRAHETAPLVGDVRDSVLGRVGVAHHVRQHSRDADAVGERERVRGEADAARTVPSTRSPVAPRGAHDAPQPRAAA